MTIPQPEPHPSPFPDPGAPSRRPAPPPRPEPQPDGAPDNDPAAAQAGGLGEPPVAACAVSMRLCVIMESLRGTTMVGIPRSESQVRFTEDARIVPCD